MFPYLLLLGLPLLLSSFSQTSRSKLNISIGVFCLMLFFMLALRSVSIGTDIIVYQAKYLSIAGSPWNNIPDIIREIGYGYLNKIISYYTNDFQFFLAVNAALVCIPLYLLYRYPNKDNYLKIIIFMNMAIFPMFFSGLRQSIAIALGMLAYFALPKRPIVFLLIVVIAFFFHHSSVVLLILLPFAFFPIRRKYLLLLIPLFAFFIVFKTQIASIVMLLISSSEDLAIYTERYNSFADTGAYGSLVLFVLFTLFSYIYADEKRLSQKGFFLRNILVIASFFQLVALINPTMMRINYYFIAFIPLAVPVCLEACSKIASLTVNLLKVAIAIFLTLFYLNRAFYGADNFHIYPYEFFWDKI